MFAATFVASLKNPARNCSSALFAASVAATPSTVELLPRRASFQIGAARGAEEVDNSALHVELQAGRVELELIHDSVAEHELRRLREPVLRRLVGDLAGERELPVGITAANCDAAACLSR